MLRRRWSEDFKERAVAAALEPGVNVSALARRMGISPAQLFGWRRHALAKGAALGVHVAIARLTENSGLEHIVSATAFALTFSAVGLSALRGRGAVRLSAILGTVGYWGGAAGTLGATMLVGPVDLEAVWNALSAGSLAAAASTWAVLIRGAVQFPLARRLASVA